jgi:exopolysaccharide biosynthesis polyprenyl glycosylphosphotransferase
LPTQNSNQGLVFRTVRWIGDVLVGLLALYFAFQIRIHLPVPMTEGLLPRDRLQLSSPGLLVLLSQNLILYLFGFYQLRRPHPRLELIRRLLAATSVQGLAMMAFYFLTATPFPRTVLAIFIPVHLVLLFLFRWILQSIRAPARRRVAIVGTSEVARELAANIEQYHWHGLEVAGHVPNPEEGRIGRATTAADQLSLAALGPRLGSVNDLPDLMSGGAVDMVVLASSPDDWQSRLVDRLARNRDARGTVLLLPSPYESLIGRTRFRSIRDMALIEVVRESEWLASMPTKRALDLGVSILLLVLLSPILLMCALMVATTSRGPVIYRQVRVGRDRREFQLLKFRTMIDGAETHGDEQLATPDDPRVTPVGRIMRQTRLDELPQLINVVQGSMSLVGPRPERPGFVEQYLEDIPGYIERFAVRPGLTGLAQVNGDYHSSAQNKLRYDLAYLANWNLFLDLSLLFRTLRIVVSTQGT